MNTNTGKIHFDPSAKEMEEHKLTPLQQREYDLVRHLPEEDRPVVLALARYCEDRKRLGRAVQFHEKVAFKIGYELGRKSSQS